MWVSTHVYRQPQRPGEGIRLTGAGIAVNCELPDSGPFQEQQVLLTTESPLQPTPNSLCDRIQGHGISYRKE